MKTSKVVPCAALFTVALLLTSCGGTSTGVGPDVPSRPLAAILEDEDNAFDKGMVQTGIVETLRKPRSYTLFVPDSDAFTRVLYGFRLNTELSQGPPVEERVLGYKVGLGTQVSAAFSE
jgi:predicted small secreted protein